MGTTHYLAPESIIDGEETEAVDIWSLGVIIYEIVARENPFKPKKVELDENPDFQTYDNITNVEVNYDVLKKAKSYNKDLEDIIRLFLVKDPIERYKNFQNIKKHFFFKSINWENILKINTGLVPWVKKIEKQKGEKNVESKETKEIRLRNESRRMNVDEFPSEDIKKHSKKTHNISISRYEMINQINNEIIKEDIKDFKPDKENDEDFPVNFHNL